MNRYAAWTLTVLYWISYPICFVLYYIALAISYVLWPVYRVVLFLLLPVAYFARLAASALIWPFLFLARFEVTLLLNLKWSSRSNVFRLCTSIWG